MSPTSTASVIGVFDDYSTAEQAVRSLREAGISDSSIRIESNFKTTGAGSTDSDSSGHEEGGFMGWWHRTFGSDNEDEYGGHYAEAVRRGSTIVSVTGAQGLLDRASQILNSAGAVDIDQRVEAYRSGGYQGYTSEAPAYDYDTAIDERARYGSGNQGTTIPVIEEELQVGKREVNRGGVRVHSRLVERPVDEQINLREEHVRVERRPVDRALTSADLDNLQDQSIEVIETAEEAVISKKARVREEVVIGKEATERTEHVKDTVRSTEVTVDPIESTQTSSSRKV